MSVTRKTLVAVPALVVASALFVATSQFTPVERTVQTTGTVDLDEEGIGEVVALISLPQLAEIDLRPEILSAHLWVRNDEARRSTHVLRLDFEGAKAVRLRDGVWVNLHFDDSCPEPGDCVIEVPLRLEGRKNRSEDIFVGVTLAADQSDGVVEEGTVDSDGEPVPGFEDLVVQVDIVLPE